MIILLWGMTLCHAISSHQQKNCSKRLGSSLSPLATDLRVMMFKCAKFQEQLATDEKDIVMKYSKVETQTAIKTRFIYVCVSIFLLKQRRLLFKFPDVWVSYTACDPVGNTTCSIPQPYMFICFFLSSFICREIGVCVKQQNNTRGGKNKLPDTMPIKF